MGEREITIGGQTFVIDDTVTAEAFQRYAASQGLKASPAEISAAFAPARPPAAPVGGGGEASAFMAPGGVGDVGLRFAQGAGSEIDPRQLVGLASAFEEERKKYPGMPYEAVLAGMLTKGLVAPLRGVPAAARQLASGDVRGGADAMARSIPIVGPTYGNVSDRVGRGDYAGAAGAGLMGAATTLLPAARAASPALAAKVPSVGQMAGRAATYLPRELGGVPLARSVLNATEPEARAVLAEGGLRTSIPGGIRRIGDRAEQATQAAIGSAPPGVRLGSPARTGFGPEVTKVYNQARGVKDTPTALVAEEVKASTAAPTMHAPTLGDAIRQAENTRTRIPQRGISGVLGERGIAADAERAIATDLLGRVRPQLGNAGQRAIDDLNRLSGVRQTLAAAPRMGNSAGSLAGGLGSNTRSAMAHLAASGAAPISQLLYGQGASSAIDNLVKAAVLARLTGMEQEP
jgi:hypothetical protein